MQPVVAGRSLHCSQCAAALDVERFENGQWRDCPYCRTPLQLFIFPAWSAGGAAPDPGSQALLEGEAACFFHADKRAVVPCDSCGRFLCSLCRLEFPDRNLCPACLQPGQDRPQALQLENSRTLYDTIALAVAALPAILIYPTIITAPIALFLTWRHWKTPLSLVPRSRIRFWLTIVLALLELVLLALLVIVLVYAAMTRSTPPPR